MRRSDLHLLVGELLDVVDGEQDVARLGRRQQRLLHRDRVHGVAVDQQRPLGEVVAGAPQGVGVVPLLGLVVVHEGELDSVALLQLPLAIVYGLRRVPDDDHDLAQPHRGEVPQRDVHDRRLTVDRHERLGQRVGVRPQASSGSSGQHHSQQRALLSRA
jgi:hypothetical protein